MKKKTKKQINLKVYELIRIIVILSSFLIFSKYLTIVLDSPSIDYSSYFTEATVVAVFIVIVVVAIEIMKFFKAKLL